MSEAAEAWEALGDRQRAYLEAAYREDQRAEDFERSAFSRGLSRRPADEWRWIPYGSSLVGSFLQAALKVRGLVYKGTGSTFAALRDRGLLLTRHRSVPVRLGKLAGNAGVLDVRMTRKGRGVARATLGEEAPKKPPPGTLEEWHRRALARAYAAGKDGLPDDGGGYYGKVGRRTWLGLRDYRSKRDGYRGLVEGRHVAPCKAGTFSESSHRLFVTPDGERFYRERWAEYRKRYPKVDAPAPESETEAKDGS
ncbi:MAG: hypothetical protein AB1425_16210 [Actinomycetota bacterium]